MRGGKKGGGGEGDKKNEKNERERGHVCTGMGTKEGKTS